MSIPPDSRDPNNANRGPDGDDGSFSLPGSGAAHTVDVQWSRETRSMALYGTPLVGLMTALTTVKQRRGTLPSTVHVHPEMAELLGGSAEFLREVLAERSLDLVVNAALDLEAVYFEFVHPSGLVRIGMRSVVPTTVEHNLLRLRECTPYELAKVHDLLPEPTTPRRRRRRNTEE